MNNNFLLIILLIASIFCIDFALAMNASSSDQIENNISTETIIPEIAPLAIALISGIVGSYLTYYFAIKSKKVEYGKGSGTF